MMAGSLHHHATKPPRRRLRRGQVERATALLQIEQARGRTILKALDSMPAVETVERIKGPYDLILRLQDSDVKAALEDLRALNGVRRVLACLPRTGKAETGRAQVP